MANDPRWQSLSEDSRFKALMADVIADINGERLQLERIEATDNFVASLDRVLGNRSSVTR